MSAESWQSLSGVMAEYERSHGRVCRVRSKDFCHSHVDIRASARAGVSGSERE